MALRVCCALNGFMCSKPPPKKAPASGGNTLAGDKAHRSRTVAAWESTGHKAHGGRACGSLFTIAPDGMQARHKSDLRALERCGQFGQRGVRWIALSADDAPDCALWHLRSFAECAFVGQAGELLCDSV